MCVIDSGRVEEQLFLTKESIIDFAIILSHLFRSEKHFIVETNWSQTCEFTVKGNFLCHAEKLKLRKHR